MKELNCSEDLPSETVEPDLANRELYMCLDEESKKILEK